jgi:hypothetical protein
VTVTKSFYNSSVSCDGSTDNAKEITLTQSQSHISLDTNGSSKSALEVPSDKIILHLNDKSQFSITQASKDEMRIAKQHIDTAINLILKESSLNEDIKFYKMTKGAVQKAGLIRSNSWPPSASGQSMFR